jgi:cyanophycin synthetase
MKVLKTRVMRGPNYWSVQHHELVVLEVRFEDAKLLNLVPQFALEMQDLAGMKSDFAKVAPAAKDGVAYVIFSYVVAHAGIYAAEAAVKLINGIAAGMAVDFEKHLRRLKQIHRRESLGPSTQAIADAAGKRNIPVRRLDQHSLLMLGHGHQQQLVRATIAGTTSSIAVDLACHKEYTKKTLSQGYIPTPKGLLITDEQALLKAISKIGFPLVVKPLDGNHGRGITTNINHIEDAKRAFLLAKEVSEEVILENYIAGDDYRLLVINYKLVAASKRIPAHVIGDGMSTIKALIDEVNRQPGRGYGHEDVLTKITVDASTEALLSAAHLSLSSILPQGQILKLKDTANLSSGGTATDVTDEVHPGNVFLAERVARLMNLDICGIDIVSPDIAIPLTDGHAAVIEVNAAPGLRMHTSPSAGRPRDAAMPIVEMLFPGNATGRIPITAIAGSNGTTTTAGIIAFIARQAGYYVGLSATDGIYLQEQLIAKGDCSDPDSAAVILKDPLVDFAVLECGSSGIWCGGLAFDQCRVSVITSVTIDELGFQGIETLEQLVKLKAVLAQSTVRDGYAILNADDDLVYAMKEGLQCNIALYSLNAAAERITAHCNKGHFAAFTEDGYFIIFNGKEKIRLIRVKDMPLTLSGQAQSKVMDMLPALLAAYLNQISVEDIKAYLTNIKRNGS